MTRERLKALPRLGVLLLFVATIFCQFFTPGIANAQKVHEYALPGPVQFTLSAGNMPYSEGPWMITAGPDGNLWFTEWVQDDIRLQSPKIGRMTPSGQLTEFGGLVPGASASDITAGPDGNLWIVQPCVRLSIYSSCDGTPSYIGKISPTGVVNEYQIAAASSPNEITSGADGNIWFTESYMSNPVPPHGAIGRMSTTGDGYVEFQLPEGLYPISITPGADGNIWFSYMTFSADREGIGRITLAGDLSLFDVHQGSQAGPFTVASGPDGNIWFTETMAGKIGRMTTQGTLTEFDTGADDPEYITTGPDGNLWFTMPQGGGPLSSDWGAGRIGRITPTGQVTISGCDVSTFYGPRGLYGGVPAGITAGPDGNVWFTEWFADKIIAISTANFSSQCALPVDAPTGLTVGSPTKEPVLSWNAAADADHYEIYRDGVLAGTTSETSFTDTAAAEGEHNYYVVTVGNAGQKSAASSIVTALVDKTAPSISYTVTPAPNNEGWNNTNTHVAFTCTDQPPGKMLSCSDPVDITNETSGQTVTGLATDTAGNTATANVQIKLDKTKPLAANLKLSTRLIFFVGSIDISADASDTLSGISNAEYYLDTDPGTGNGTPLTYNQATGKVTGTYSVGFNGLPPFRAHTIYVRVQDQAGNWSDTASLTFFYV